MLSTDELHDVALLEELARWLEDRIRDAQEGHRVHGANMRAHEEAGKVIAFSRTLNWIRAKQRKRA